MYSTGNIVKNTIITAWKLMVTRLSMVITSQGRYKNVESLCCKPETNIILYANDTLIKQLF